MRTLFCTLGFLIGLGLGITAQTTRRKATPNPQPQSRIEHSKPVRLDPDAAFPLATLIHDDATGHDYLVVWNPNHIVVTPMLSDDVPAPHAIDTRVSY